MRPFDVSWRPSPMPRPTIQILAVAIAASAICAGLRIKMLLDDGVTAGSLYELWAFTRFGLRNSFFDITIVWAVALVCLVASLMTTKTGRFGNTIAALFFGAAILYTLLVCANVVTVRFIGGPLTFQQIYYSDLLRSFFARTAGRPLLNTSFLAMVILSLIGWFIVYTVSVWSLRRLQGTRLLGPILVLACALLVTYIGRFLGEVEGLSEGQRRYVTSPLVALVATALAAPSTELVLPDGEGLALQSRATAPTANRDLVPGGLQKGVVRNVVLIIMESVGADYVAGTGPTSAARLTPRLASFGASTLAFPNFYAHVPISTKSLFSILTARYPIFSYDIETTEQWSTDLQTLSGRMKEAGLRTAFFMAGNFEFQGADAFLDGRGFDFRSDVRSIACAAPRYVNEWLQQESVDDSCAADAMVRWIEADSKVPFFAMLWTGNTHWPYFTPQEPAPETFASEHPPKSRYLRALRSSDEMVGGLLDYLAKRGLFDSTLVVVIGDHGQAFGEHGFRTHGNSIYDEETRIPLLLIHPRIEGPAQDDTLGGLVDLAPTLIHVLGLRAEPTWDGRSLFDPNRSSRVYLFAPNQDMEVGYREGNHKFVYRGGQREPQVFDLATDPAETLNIANEYSVGIMRRELAIWLDQQNRRTIADLGR